MGEMSSYYGEPYPELEEDEKQMPSELEEAMRLLTACCYTINALADQQAMPDHFYEDTLKQVQAFMDSPKPIVQDDERARRIVDSLGRSCWS